MMRGCSTRFWNSLASEAVPRVEALSQSLFVAAQLEKD